jgi:hypothetical protein
MLFALTILQLYSGETEAVSLLQVYPTPNAANERNYSQWIRMSRRRIQDHW